MRRHADMSSSSEYYPSTSASDNNYESDDDEEEGHNNNSNSNKLSGQLPSSSSSPVLQHTPGASWTPPTTRGHHRKHSSLATIKPEDLKEVQEQVAKLAQQLSTEDSTPQAEEETTQHPIRPEQAATGAEEVAQLVPQPIHPPPLAVQVAPQQPLSKMSVKREVVPAVATLALAGGPNDSATSLIHRSANQSSTALNSIMGDGLSDQHNNNIAVGNAGAVANPLLTNSSTPGAGPAGPAQSSGAPNMLKIKKSLDNIGGAKSASTASLIGPKKKKKIRPGTTSKVEQFAARVASAIDEAAQSSDSDETFVYESNANAPDRLVRPRFQSRNPSSSSIAHRSNDDGMAYAMTGVSGPASGPGQGALLPSALLQSVAAGSVPPLISDTENEDPVTNLSRRSPRNPRNPADLTASRNSAKYNNATTSDSSSTAHPAGSTHPNPAAINASSVGYDSLRRKRKPNHAWSSSSPSPYLSPRPEPGSQPQQQQRPRYGRWQRRGGYLAEEEEDYDDSDGDVDDDEDEYSETTPLRRGRNTSVKLEPGHMGIYGDQGLGPLTQGQVHLHGGPPALGGPGAPAGAIGGLVAGGGNGGSLKSHGSYNSYNSYSSHSGEGGQGYGSVSRHNLRRSRKAGMGAGVHPNEDAFFGYSPHNYQQKSNKRRSLYYVRMLIWLVVIGICILGTGFIFGFLLATSKPLIEVKVSRIFDVMVSDELLAFELVIEGINPGYLDIQMERIDMDIFARSPYVGHGDDDGDDNDGDDDDAKSHHSVVVVASDKSGGKDKDKDKDKDDGEHTMLLGNVNHFDVPLVFEGRLFDKRIQKAVADVKLPNPGRNVTGEDGSDEKEIGESGKDSDDYYSSYNKELDDGQKKWTRVNPHPFELIVRGSLKYELMFGRKHSVSIAHTVHVDPNTSY